MLFLIRFQTSLKMMFTLKFQSLACVFILFLSCTESEKPPYDLPANAATLISGEKGKTWKLARRFNNGTRMNMGDCFLSYRITYRPDQTMNDNNGDHNDCGPTLYAKWRIVKSEKGHSYLKIDSDQLPELMGIEASYKVFKILQISADQLTLQFSHRQFSSKKTTMIDVLVPESAQIEDREFHW